MTKKIKRKVNNKLRGAYGQTDFYEDGTKKITVNKKAHKSKRLDRIKKNKDGTENLLNTIVHEEQHAHHPRMHEKTVRKEAIRKIKKMSKKQKVRYYKKYA